MYQKERMKEILKVINQKKVVDVKELEKLIFVSRSTLRRDLIELEKEQKIIRHFGQIELVKDTNMEFGYNIRAHENEQSKKMIAEIADNFIGNNQALFIDSSSTCIQLWPYLVKRDKLIIITNGIHLAYSLVESPHIKTFVCGGRLKELSGSILGETSIDYLNNFHADLAFISCTGFDESGIYMASEDQSFIKRKMLSLSDQVVLLCDSSKAGKKDYFRMCGYDQIDYLIMDSQLSKEMREFLESKQVEVLY